MKYIDKIVLKIKNRRKKLLIEGSLKEVIADAKITNIKSNRQLKILFAPGFNIVPSFVYHDVIVGAILFSKGVALHYASDCDGLKSRLMFGGVWSRGGARRDFRFLQKSEKYARNFFKKFSETSKIKDFVTEREIDEVSRKVSSLSVEDMRNYSIDDIHLGHDAENRVRNLNLVSDICLVEGYKDELADCLIDCIVYYKYFTRLIEYWGPDRVFSHESFFYPWSIMRKIALKLNIPFYNYYTAVRKGVYTYSKDKPSLDMDMTAIWNKQKDRMLPLDKKNKIMSLIDSERRKGKVGRYTQVRVNDVKQNLSILRFSKKKPTAVLYGNVCWDVCALDKEIIFSSIRQAYVGTIQFFIDNPQYQLIIKSHPDEEHPRLPTTIEKLQDTVESSFSKLPENVIILPPKTSVSAYELFQVSKCSIVYTSTVGMESVILGTPVITLASAHYRGKRFTYDPETEVDYKQILMDVLEGKSVLSQKDQDQALKYYYFYYYELFYDYGIPPFGDDDNKIIEKKCVSDYLENERLDKLIRSIIRGENVYG